MQVTEKCLRGTAKEISKSQLDKLNEKQRFKRWEGQRFLLRDDGPVFCFGAVLLIFGHRLKHGLTHLSHPQQQGRNRCRGSCAQPGCGRPISLSGILDRPTVHLLRLRGAETVICQGLSTRVQFRPFSLGTAKTSCHETAPRSYQRCRREYAFWYIILLPLG